MTNRNESTDVTQTDKITRRGEENIQSDFYIGCKQEASWQEDPRGRGGPWGGTMQRLG